MSEHAGTPRLQEIRERAEQASQGPWTIKHELNVICPDPRGGHMSPFSNSNLSHEQQLANVEFAAHAREDVPFLLTLAEENALLRKALLRVIDSPWEPDKWRLDVEKALGIDGPKTARDLIKAALSGEPVPPAHNGTMNISTREYGNLLAIWQTAVMYFGGMPDELLDVEAMRARMRAAAPVPPSAVSPQDRGKQ